MYLADDNKCCIFKTASFITISMAIPFEFVENLSFVFARNKGGAWKSSAIEESDFVCVCVGGGGVANCISLQSKVSKRNTRMTDNKIPCEETNVI